VWLAASTIIVGLIGVKTAHAQEPKEPPEHAPTTAPAVKPPARQKPEGPKKLSLVREIGRFDREIDKKKVDCALCDGKGWIKKRNGTREECWQCEGQKRVLPRRDNLAAYVAYLDFCEQHAEELAEKADKKFVKQFHERHSEYLRTIKRLSGAVEAQPARRWQGSSLIVEGHGAYDYCFTEYALEVILSGGEKVGETLAFNGSVLSITETAGRTVAKVAVESVEHPGVTCSVIVPKGAQWASQSGVFVIGKVVSSDENMVTVSPYPGTE
jgi:hypothetical protein